MKSCPILLFAVAVVLMACARHPASKGKETVFSRQPTADNGKRWILSEEQQSAAAHHTRHLDLYGRGIDGINRAVLAGIDRVQAQAPDGGGYFTGLHADPPESPVYYDLGLFGRPLIDIPRRSSYCSGATYAAFIEALNLLYPDGVRLLSDDRYEALRMQEIDGGRREDDIKFWGNWNADGFGNHFALVQYSGMGTVVQPEQCRPGDFVNIAWKEGLGHSVIFLGWIESKDQSLLLYWSSQTGTNGYGDQATPLSRIKSIKAVRLTLPDRVFTFSPDTPIEKDIPGDPLF